MYKFALGTNSFLGARVTDGKYLEIFFPMTLKYRLKINYFFTLLVLLILVLEWFIGVVEF
jgi:hypothetical protein